MFQALSASVTSRFVADCLEVLLMILLNGCVQPSAQAHLRECWLCPSFWKSSQARLVCLERLRDMDFWQLLLISDAVRNMTCVRDHWSGPSEAGLWQVTSWGFTLVHRVSRGLVLALGPMVRSLFDPWNMFLGFLSCEMKEKDGRLIMET